MLAEDAQYLLSASIVYKKVERTVLFPFLHNAVKVLRRRMYFLSREIIPQGLLLFSWLSTSWNPQRLCTIMLCPDTARSTFSVWYDPDEPRSNGTVADESVGGH